jgi:hypothetical protein
MTTEEVEDVVRALNAVVEYLETRVAKQSIQDAFLQVRAHAGELSQPQWSVNSSTTMAPFEVERRLINAAQRAERSFNERV